jgi:hypothetical protein
VYTGVNALTELDTQDYDAMWTVKTNGITRYVFITTSADVKGASNYVYFTNTNSRYWNIANGVPVYLFSETTVNGVPHVGADEIKVAGTIYSPGLYEVTVVDDIYTVIGLAEATGSSALSGQGTLTVVDADTVMVGGAAYRYNSATKVYDVSANLQSMDFALPNGQNVAYTLLQSADPATPGLITEFYYAIMTPGVPITLAPVSVSQADGDTASVIGASSETAAFTAANVVFEIPVAEFVDLYGIDDTHDYSVAITEVNENTNPQLLVSADGNADSGSKTYYDLIQHNLGIIPGTALNAIPNNTKWDVVGATAAKGTYTFMLQVFDLGPTLTHSAFPTPIVTQYYTVTFLA